MRLQKRLQGFSMRERKVLLQRFAECFGMQRPVPPTMSGEEEIVLTIPPGNLRTAVI